MRKIISTDVVKKGRKAQDYECLRESISRCKNAMSVANEEYYTKLVRSLNDPGFGTKKYCSILHRLLCKRIPPIQHKNTDYRQSEKATLFNPFFFTNQCTVIQTGSILPDFHFLTNHRLDKANFDSAKILSIIHSLNVNKAHGWDEISIRMVKICDEALVLPLQIIFISSYETRIFPNYWKRGNLTPVHKK